MATPARARDEARPGPRRAAFRVEYQALPKDGTDAGSRGPRATIRDIIERRVNSTGVSEPVVQTQGTDRVVVELPGVSDTEDDREARRARPAGSTSCRSRADSTARTRTRAAAGRRGPAAADREPPLFSGDQIEQREPDGTDQHRPARRRLHAEATQGAKLFADYTANNVGDYFAIVLDGKVDLAPRSSRARSPAARCRSPGRRHRRLPAKEVNEPGDRCCVRLAAVPDRRSCRRTTDQRRRSARSSCSQTPARGRHRHRSSSSRSCSSTTGCRASSRASR